MTTTMYVGNLSFSTTEDDLRKLFSTFGSVESIRLIKEAATQRSRGFGFVTMTSDRAAQQAIDALNSTAFMNRTITVSEARPQKSRDRHGGAGSGGSGFGGRNRDRGPGTGSGRR